MKRRIILSKMQRPASPSLREFLVFLLVLFHAWVDLPVCSDIWLFMGSRALFRLDRFPGLSVRRAEASGLRLSFYVPCLINDSEADYHSCCSI